MIKQDFYNTKKLLHKPELKFGDNSEYLLELAHKINEEATYQNVDLNRDRHSGRIW